MLAVKGAFHPGSRRPLTAPRQQRLRSAEREANSLSPEGSTNMKSSTAFASREREQCIIDHLPQVRMLAQQLHRRCPASVLLEDLVSAGVTGLIEAADRYDARRNVKLKTLAVHRIRGAMFDYLRSLDPLPRAVRRFARDRDTVVANLEQRRDTVLSEEEIALTMGVSIDRYRRLLQSVHEAGVTVSLDHLDGFAVSSDACTHRSAWDSDLEDAIRALPARERAVILSLRDGYTLGEIATRFAVTQGRVSQIKKQALIRLQIALGIAPGSQLHRST